MKALTISQPFASLIATGKKFVENRTWETKYRGQVLIHAGKGTQYMTAREMKEEGLPTGKIVAVAELAHCWRISEIRRYGNATLPPPMTIRYTWKEIHEHPHTEGPWCWILENVIPLDPIEATGALVLWTPRPETLQLVTNSLGKT